MFQRRYCMEHAGGEIFRGRYIVILVVTHTMMSRLCPTLHVRRNVPSISLFFFVGTRYETFWSWNYLLTWNHNDSSFRDSQCCCWWWCRCSFGGSSRLFWWWRSRARIGIGAIHFFQLDVVLGWIGVGEWFGPFPHRLVWVQVSYLVLYIFRSVCAIGRHDDSTPEDVSSSSGSCPAENGNSRGSKKRWGFSVQGSVRYNISSLPRFGFSEPTDQSNGFLK